MALVDSITKLKKALNGTIQTVPALIETLKNALTGVEEASELVDSSSTYSTDEHIVGKWIDGSEIFEKTYNFGALPNTDTKTMTHGITNLDKVIDITAISKSSNSNITIPFTAAGFSHGVRIIIEQGDIKIAANANYSSYTDTYVTLRYTKATPTRDIDSLPEEDTDNQEKK